MSKSKEKKSKSSDLSENDVIRLYPKDQNSFEMKQTENESHNIKKQALGENTRR